MASLLERKKTRTGFERAADTYDEAAVLQREVGRRLLDRLDYLKAEPETVLDLGCGTGFITENLLQKYRKATIFATDIAESMGAKTQSKGGWLRKPKVFLSDANQLPLKSSSVDLLISNLMLQWCNNLTSVFRGLDRVMKPGSALMFTTFGPDTLKEIRTCWEQVDGLAHTSTFTDMHDVGDALLQSGFTQPVVDMEIITLTYSSPMAVLQDLKRIGATNATEERSRGLMGKARLKAFEKAYEQFRLPDGTYPLTYEVIYAHAWSANSIDGEGYIPIKAI